MKTDYRTSHTEPGKGKSYHEVFFNNPHRRMVWQQEQSIFDRIFTTFFKDKQPDHLDFACGTGRILSCLSDKVKHSVGVDLSPSMLEVARKNNQNAEIIEGDLTANNVLGNRKFDLITAFRFFPNAQPKLRNEVMQVLSTHLKDDGYVVFNNHRNTRSTVNRVYGMFGSKGYPGMDTAQVKELLDNNGLEIVKIYHLCVFPATEERTILPIFLLQPLETVFSKVGFLQDFGQNLVFVCRKSKNN